MTRYLFQYRGRKPVQSTNSLNLGKCRVCGTCNPSIPGEGFVEKCGGCGSELPRASAPIQPGSFDFIERRKGKSTLNGSSK